MNRRRFLTLACISAAVSPVALAHQQKAAITSVKLNARTGLLEVAHRYIVHDAEHALRMLGQPEAALIESEATREAFAQYVLDRFRLSLADGSDIALTYLGCEIERGALWIYQEGAPPPADTKMLVLESGGLRDVWPSQVNTVNVDLDGTVRSLVFSGADKAKILQLPD